MSRGCSKLANELRPPPLRKGTKVTCVTPHLGLEVVDTSGRRSKQSRSQVGQHNIDQLVAGFSLRQLLPLAQVSMEVLRTLIPIRPTRTDSGESEKTILSQCMECKRANNLVAIHFQALTNHMSKKIATHTYKYALMREHPNGDIL